MRGLLLALAIVAGSLEGLVWAQDHMPQSEVLDADVGASWSAARPILPPGERGQLYPGERVTLGASGRIDRNHVHREEDETVFLFFKKTKVIDYPQWVNHDQHPLQVTLLPESGGDPLFGPQRIPRGGLSFTVPGEVDAPARLHAFVPNGPVTIDRATSYGAYQLEARIDSAPRLELVRRTLSDRRMTAQAIQSPNFLNRRLRERFEHEVAAAILEQYRLHHRTHADRQAAEAVIQLAVELAPASGVARAELAEFLIQSGRWEEADQQYRRAVDDLRSSASDSRPGTWRSLGEAELRLAQVSEAKAGGLTPQETLNAEFWYGEAAAAFERGGEIIRAVEAYRHQARVLWQLDRSRAASEKARRVLARAVRLAPSLFDGDFLGASPDGRYGAFVAQSAAFMLSPVGGGPGQTLGVSSLTSAEVLAYDSVAERLLLRAENDLHWWSPRQPRRVERAPGTLPQLTRASALNGHLLAVTTEGRLLHAGPGEAVVPVTLDPENPGISVDLTALNGSGGFAAAGGALSLLGGGDVSVYVYDSQRQLQRRVLVARVQLPVTELEREGATAETFEEALRGATFEIPTQLALGSRGDLLVFIGNLLNPGENRWLLIAPGDEPRRVAVPPAPGPATPPSGGDGNPNRNSWYSEETVGRPGAYPDSPFYWWANGSDVRREWSHGSFTPDGQSVIISNARAGLVELNAGTGTVRRIFSRPRLAQAAESPRFPLGHRWTADGQILVAWAEAEGMQISRVWLVQIRPATGQMTETELDDRQRELFLRLGEAHGHTGAAVLVGDGVSLAERVGESLRLVDLRAGRIEAAVSQRGFYVTPRGLVFDDRRVALDTPDGIVLIEPATGARSTLAGLHYPQWLPGGEWYATGEDGIHRFRGHERAGFVAWPAGSHVRHRFGRFALVGQGEEEALRLYDVTGAAAARDFALTAPGDLLAFSVSDRGVNAISRRTGGRLQSIWVETAAGQAVIVANRTDPPPSTDRSELAATVSPSEDGRSFLIVVTQTDVDDGWFSRETLRVTHRLFHVDAAGGVVTPVALGLPITEANLSASPDLSLYVVVSGGAAVAIERASGRIVARMEPSGGGSHATLTGSGVIFSGYRSLAAWSWPACLADAAAASESARPAWCGSTSDE